MAYQVFISYSHEDADYANSVEEAIRREGVDVWLDNRLLAGTRWDRIVESKIDTCSAFVILMSPASEKSEWVNREIARAQQLKKPIFPLLLSGQPFFRLSDLQFEMTPDGRKPSSDWIKRVRDIWEQAVRGLPKREEAESVDLADLAEFALKVRASRRLVDEGMILEDFDRINEALRKYEAAAESDPDNIVAHRRMAELLVTLRRPKDALSAISKAMELDPGSSGLLVERKRIEALLATDNDVPQN